MAKEKQIRRNGWRRFLFVWHWRIGLAATLFLIILTISGILLNHSRTLGLHDIDLTTQGMLNWYDIKIPLEQIDKPIITMERVLIDIHSGRFFGTAGPWVMDLAGLALLFLLSSGIYNWYKRWQNTK